MMRLHDLFRHARAIAKVVGVLGTVAARLGGPPRGASDEQALGITGLPIPDDVASAPHQLEIARLWLAGPSKQSAALNVIFNDPPKVADPIAVAQSWGEIVATLLITVVTRVAVVHDRSAGELLGVAAHAYVDTLARQAEIIAHTKKAAQTS